MSGHAWDPTGVHCLACGLDLLDSDGEACGGPFERDEIGSVSYAEYVRLRAERDAAVKRVKAALSMRVVLRDRDFRVVGLGVVDCDDGYDGCPIIEWEGRHFTATGGMVNGSRVYIERTVRKVRDAKPGEP